MAKLQDTTQPTTENVEQNTVSTENTAPQTKTKASSNDDALSKIMSRIDQLEEANRQKDAIIKDLQKWEKNTFQAAKEKYQGVLTFSYKMRGWVPVLSYTSKRKNPSKDLMFKNVYGEMESNHLVELHLADDTTVDVEVNEFNQSVQRSEKITAKDHRGDIIDTDTKLPKVEYFVFDTPEYGEIKVLPYAIN